MRSSYLDLLLCNIKLHTVHFMCFIGFAMFFFKNVSLFLDFKNNIWQKWTNIMTVSAIFSRDIASQSRLYNRWEGGTRVWRLAWVAWRFGFFLRKKAHLLVLFSNSLATFTRARDAVGLDSLRQLFEDTAPSFFINFFMFSTRNANYFSFCRPSQIFVRKG